MVPVVDGLREVVRGVLGSLFIVAERGGREWEGVVVVAVEVAEEGVGRIGDVVVL